MDKDKELADVLVNVGEVYNGYLDSIISLLESMLTEEQLEEVERKVQERKDRNEK